ncbi:Holliday junction branch migration protein RuvA [Bartonella sp. B41]
MIGKLKGVLEHIFDDHIILDVQGVGYIVFVSKRLHSSLPALGENLSLFTEMHVREDAIRLFGFVEKAEQEWFCLLQNVPGVGAKVALAILGTLSPDELSQAIASDNTTVISGAPGVGKKVSARIVSELKSKALPLNSGSFHLASAPRMDFAQQPTNDALSALVKLGFEREQAASAVYSAMNALEGKSVSTELLIRHSLKLLSIPLSTR